jgi:hypothetical protein
MLAYSSGQWAAFWGGIAAIVTVLIAVGNRWLDARRERTRRAEAKAAERQGFDVSVHRTTRGTDGVQTLGFTLDNRSDVTWIAVTAVVVVSRPPDTETPPLPPEFEELSNQVDWAAYASCALVSLPLGKARAREITAAPVDLSPPGLRDVAGLVEFSHPDGTTYRADIDRMNPIKFGSTPP